MPTRMRLGALCSGVAFGVKHLLHLLSAARTAAVGASGSDWGAPKMAIRPSPTIWLTTPPWPLIALNIPTATQSILNRIFHLRITSRWYAPTRMLLLGLFAQIGHVASQALMLPGVGLFGLPNVLHDRISVFHFNPSKISSGVAITGTNDPNFVSASSMFLLATAPTICRKFQLAMNCTSCSAAMAMCTASVNALAGIAFLRNINLRQILRVDVHVDAEPVHRNRPDGCALLVHRRSAPRPLPHPTSTNPPARASAAVDKKSIAAWH